MLLRREGTQSDLGSLKTEAREDTHQANPNQWKARVAIVTSEKNRIQGTININRGKEGHYTSSKEQFTKDIKRIMNCTCNSKI